MMLSENNREVIEVNKVAGYRKMVNKSQQEMADELGLSINGYRRKEKGVVEFKRSEMTRFTDIVRSVIPSITELEIFF